jgi:hypothetical protein
MTAAARLLAALALAWAWAWGRPALAADPFGVVTVDLRPQAGEVPTHICVVSQDRGPRARTTLGEFLASEPSADATLLVRPQAWDGVEGGATDCTGTDGTSCAARVELPQGAGRASDLWAACTADSLLSVERARHPRLLVLLLEHLEGSPPAIESLNLTGGVATVGVRAELRRIIVTARSLGGHYAPHERAYRAERSGTDSTLVVLPITPRCRAIDLVLPGARLRTDDRARLRVTANGSDLDVESCVGSLRGTSRVTVQLPGAPVDAGALEVFLAPREGEPPGATRFGGRWEGAWPPGRFELVAEQVGFWWQPPACIYPRDECPVAVLDGGAACSATAIDGKCRYTCPGQVDEAQILEIDFPVAVTFTKSSPAQSWNDVLQRPGQTLGSYVGGEQTYLRAEIGGWKTRTPGSRIDAFEILGNDGTTRRYGVGGAKSLDVQVPGATCEPVRYELVGDRHYVEGVAVIEDGRLDFGDPHRTARILSFNLVLLQGGGLSIIPNRAPNVRTEAYFAGLAQLAASFRPRRPALARLAIELRVGGMLGQWGYYGPESVGDDERRVRTKLAWARFLFEPAIVVDVVHPLAISAGLGVGSSWPIDGADVATTDRFPLILAPSLDARFSVRRWLSFVAQGRAVLLEKTSLYELPRGGGGGDPRQVLRGTVGLYGLYGVQLSF